MAIFHEVRFPVAIALGAVGGPQRKTEVVALRSGYEERNAVWRDSRHTYNVGSGIKTLDDLHAVIAFFEARMGRLYGFRFKDFADYKSCPPLQAVSPCDQALGTGDGANCVFALQKRYASGDGAWVRAIAKPVAGTVRLAVDGAEVANGWSLDAASGAVRFAAAPAVGAVLTAGFEFDVPVRFDTDTLNLRQSNVAAGAIADIPLVEIRL